MERHVAASAGVPLLIILGVAGCQTVDPAPFQQLNESAAAFEQGADDALGAVYQRAEENFAAGSPFGTDPTLDQLLLVWEPGGDATRPTQEVQPLHAMLRDLRRGVSYLNEALATYASYLAKLASGSADDAAAIEALAQEANTNLRSARDALKATDITDDQLALVATIGAELLRQKIERDRREYLEETMDSAQPTIEEFASFMVTTMNLVASDVTFAYAEWAEHTRESYRKAKNARAKQRILMGVLAKNDGTYALLESIRTLREGYAQFPVAHGEVRQRLEDRESALVAVRRLYSEAQHLRKLHAELAHADGGKTGAAESEKQK